LNQKLVHAVCLQISPISLLSLQCRVVTEQINWVPDETEVEVVL